MRCRNCGSLKTKRLQGPGSKIVCKSCDTAEYEFRQGETNDGNKFGDMLPEQVMFGKIRNAQMSEYSGKLKRVTEAYHRCKQSIESSPHYRGPTKEDFTIIFQLANIGRYYLCAQLKETAELLRDSGLVGKHEDPWRFDE